VKRYRELLSQPGMLRWSIVRILTRFPILAAPIAFVLLSKTQLGTYGPGAWMSAADVIVECVAAPLLGRRLDRRPMRRDIQVALVINALALLAIAAGVRHLPVPVLAALAGVAGGSIAGLIGGLRSQLTRMLSDEQAHVALSWESVLADVIFTVGPAMVAGLALGVDGRLPLVLMCAGSLTATVLVPGLPGIGESAGTSVPPADAPTVKSGALLAAWPIYLTSGAAMFISAQVEIALSPLLGQNGQPIGWTGPLLGAFSVASVIGGLCYGLRGWPGSYRVQSLVLITGLAVLFALAAVTTTDGIEVMAIPLILAGFTQAGVITAQSLAVHSALPAYLRSTGNSLMYTGSCIGYGISSVAVAVFAAGGHARQLILVTCLLTVAVALFSAMAGHRGRRRGYPPEPDALSVPVAAMPVPVPVTVPVGDTASAAGGEVHGTHAPEEHPSALAQETGEQTAAEAAWPAAAAAPNRVAAASRRPASPAGRPPWAISLAMGEPSEPTSPAVIDAAVAALHDGHTRYSEFTGMPDLRTAIASRLLARHDARVGPDQVVVTHGGSAGLGSTILALVDPGDRVVIPEPTYSLYADQVALAGGQVDFVANKPDGTLDLDALLPRLTGARLVILCNPGNPTGTVHDARDLMALGETISRTGCYLLSDESYADIVFEGRTFFSALDLPGASDLVICSRTFSKSYAMTGWRLGYVVSAVPVAQAVNLVHRTFNGPLNTFVQRAALTALQITDAELATMSRSYQERRDMVVARLAEIPQVTVAMPQGAFYAFPRVRAACSSDELTCRLAAAGVLVRSGTEYGPSGEGCFRISFATDPWLLEEGLRRIRVVISAAR
jgi:aspartate aminotransferase